EPSLGIHVDERAVFEFDTNVFNRPFTISLTGPAADLTVVDGPATLDAGRLTVHGPGPVTLGVTGTGAGSVVIHASVETLSAEHLAWHQSPHPNPDTACQI